MKAKIKEIKSLFKEYPALKYIYIALLTLGIVLLTIFFFLVSTDKNQVIRVAEVQINGEGFMPADLIVKRGTRVVWVNNTDGLHQVISNPHASHDDLSDFKSEILNNGQTYEYTFEESGTFNYHDEVRPTTNGTIKVE
jgi:plastocyanin